jgi:hypothetical protein
MSNKAPSISSPKGGGAQSGLGEKFSPDLFTGTGNFSVPIALPPGRNGFQPELTLGYSSGSGNSAFGLGWNVGVPGVMRKTSRGVPLYDDEQDVFILSGAEDLVKVKQTNVSGHLKTYYRPRTEGLYARIVHHKLVSGENYWEVRSKDGLISYYGNPSETQNHTCVLANPEIRTSIFAWKLHKTVDPFGNHIIYNYTRELVTVGKRIYDQLYLSNILYGDYIESTHIKYLLRVEFNYEVRPDPFSEYKQGFEVRTTKRCTSIEMYTLPTEEDLPEGYNSSNSYYSAWSSYRVKLKTYDFVYIDENTNLQQPLNGVSMLHSVKVTGYDLNDSPNFEEMPPLLFDYSKFTPQNRDFYPIKGNDLPSSGLNSPDMELVDLTGNGLPDILQMNGVIRWWRNKGNGEFDLPKFMQDSPSGFLLSDPNVQMIDANGDGRADLLINKPGIAGYYSTRFGGTWDKKSFKKYDNSPTFSFEDPEVKMMDLDGDGVTDVLRNGSRFECFYNHPQKGFYKTGVVNKKDIEDFPNVSFSDPRIKTAEMGGDGLQDFVYVASGNVSYWPNLGYGRFGKKITMQNSPRFPYGFDPKRILLGDIDGDGLSDLIYVENNKVTIWINKSGNAWSDAIEITGTPAINDTDSVRISDMLGSGVAGILWSSVNNSSGFAKMFFLDFTSGNKPYLLHEMNNNMGSITRVEYTSSIEYFLEDDKKPETRWKTELPFPVLVVSKVEVIDELSKGKLVTEYNYHHGYWDGAEREFRGFGRVDQRDTESFTRYNSKNLVNLTQGAAGSSQSTSHLQMSEEHYTPPTETRTWFHQGPLGDEFGDWYENDYTIEYWQGELPMLKRSELVSSSDLAIFSGLPRRAKRDALRTLRGTILRTELYALDNTVRQNRPYTVTESISFVRKDYEPSVAVDDIFKYSSGYIFFPYQVAQRTTQWERGNDPMSSFSFSWQYDNYGQALKHLSAAIARGINPLTGSAFSNTSSLFVPSVISEKKILATYSNNEFIYKGDMSDDSVSSGMYMMNRGKQSKSFDCTYAGSTAKSVVTFYHDIMNGNNIGDVLAHSLNYYDGVGSGGAFVGLSLGTLGSYGALVRTESLILTDVLVEAIYTTTPQPLQDSPSWGSEYPSTFTGQYPNMLGYIYYDDTIHFRGYYAVGARNKYDFHEDDHTAKGLIVESSDPFDAVTAITYDSYKILPTAVYEPFYTTLAYYDYRVLQPYKIIDMNNNISVFDFSPLGLLRATALIGKGDEGDYKEEGVGFYNKYEPSTRLEYDFFNFINSGKPVWVKTIKRERHFQDSTHDDSIISIEYSDGFGRLLQTRTQAEDIIFGATETKRILGDSGLPENQSSSNGNAVGVEKISTSHLNVVVSGWQVYNNKGKVVEKYEPFFDTGFDFKSND